MPFIRIPVLFADDEEEKKENLGIKAESSKGVIIINTHLICAYNEMDNGNTMARLANGDCIEAPMNIDEFEYLLSETEMILNLSDVFEN